MKERKKELTKIIHEHNELAEKGCAESQQIVINAQIELDDLADRELAYQARLQKILADVRNSDEPAEMPEVHRNHEEPSFDQYEDIDYGYHDQYDF